MLERKLVGVVCAKPCPGANWGIRKKFSGKTLVGRSMWEKTCSLLLFLKECCPNTMAPDLKGNE